MKLPNGAKAVIPEGKLEDYCLNPFRPDGKHKAKVALGITQEKLEAKEISFAIRRIWLSNERTKK